MFKDSRKIIKFAVSTTIGSCAGFVTRRLIDVVFEDEELATLENVQYTVGSIAIGAVVAEATGKYTDALVDEVCDFSDNIKKSVAEKKDSRTK